jgi:hypothetical protein
MGRIAHIRYRRHASGAGKVGFKNRGFLGFLNKFKIRFFKNSFLLRKAT